MKKESFGKISNGTETNLYTIENKNGLKIKVSDFGATLVAIEVPDKSGKPVDVVLGYDSAVEYEREMHVLEQMLVEMPTGLQMQNVL